MMLQRNGKAGWLWIFLCMLPGSAGADSVILPPDFLKSPLHKAAEHCDVAAVRTELAALPATKHKQFNQLDREGHAPLHYAAQRGCIAVAKLLLEAGAAVDATRHEFPQTPLQVAAWGRHVEMVDYLLSHGAAANFRSWIGDTPLAAAIMGSTLQIGSKGDRDGTVKVLLKHGADVNLPGRNGWTPLMYAVSHKDAALVGLLIRHGAKISAKDDAGKSALDYAVEVGEQTVMDALR